MISGKPRYWVGIFFFFYTYLIVDYRNIDRYFLKLDLLFFKIMINTWFPLSKPLSRIQEGNNNSLQVDKSNLNVVCQTEGEDIVCCKAIVYSDLFLTRDTCIIMEHFI